ncbi:MAG: ATP-binding protein [Clostridiales bacterium]|nr:ATP-binding protein [Clostridiales bacterium]
MDVEAVTTITDIPRWCTALAEWLACVVYISQCRTSLTRGRRWLLAGGALVIQVLFLELTEDVLLWLWVPCMLVAIGLMMLFIYLSCDISVITAGYYCVRAFLLAELAASLEWQLYCYNVSSQGDEVLVQEILYVAVIYAAAFGLIWYIEKYWLAGSHDSQITWRELAPAAVIGVAVFAVSNLSFYYRNTPFSSTVVSDIHSIRTLVDLSGVALLYAFHIQRASLRARYEVETLNTLLQSQYAQYRQSKESIELVNRKYHDLKHQITVLRQEPDAAARSAYLDQMEADIRSYEAQNKTGNSVLDTILTGKALQCQENHIAMTCVADGHLLDFMDTMDICSIFGNALDNAIQYEQTLPDLERRSIRLSVSQQKQFVLIHIANFFEGTLDFEDGIPQTTKGDRAFHGYGVKSIRAAAEKYRGSCSVEVEQSSFCLKLLIPLPQGADS